MVQLSSGRVLVVDDEPNALKVLSAILTAEGYAVSQEENVDGAIRAINKQDLDAVITDMRMPGRDGLQLYDYVHEHFPDLPVIFLTAYGTVESAVHAMHRGAFHYFIKPPDYNQLKGTLAQAVEQHSLKREMARRDAPRLKARGGPTIIGRHPRLQKILALIQTAKNSSSSVLVHGETGTGKELIAQALHYEGERRNKPFVAVNCAAIPSELIESELFGHEKGAFTGATARYRGKVEQATGGTLFLDEIGELALPVQAKFLRVLQEKEIERVGGNEKISVDFRLVCSTNRDLDEEVAAGRFREDLFYRINVLKLELPPLRERIDDIPSLVEAFLQEFCLREKKAVTITEEAMSRFLSYRWPGNVRQLRNVVERAVLLAQGRAITGVELPEELTAGDSVEEELQGPAPATLKELEARMIRETLRKCNGNKSKTAKMLGFSRKALYKRLHDFGIS